mmetsp:Transcript_19017/g.31648  ORF Transcript_19017/g.31648 Transcript_19017/m.31648 type:complete len:555 (-) Transcript_19017:460-2124(-)
MAYHPRGGELATPDWNNLPREIFVKIFSELHQSDLLKIVGRVCRTWRSHAYLAELWSSVGYTWPSFPISVLDHLVQTLEDPSAISSIDLRSCKDLTFSSAYQRPNYLPRCRSLPASLEELDAASPSIHPLSSPLNDAVFACLPAVCSLVLPFALPDPTLVAKVGVILLRLLPRVHSLLLTSPPKASFDLTMSTVIPLAPILARLHYLTRPSTLRSIIIEKGSRVEAESLALLLRYCPLLDSLSVSLALEGMGSGEKLADALLNYCPHLRALTVDTYDLGLSQSAWDTLSEMLNLRELVMERAQVSDEALARIAHRLETLLLSSDDLSRPVFNACSSLRTIRLSSYAIESVTLVDCPLLESVEVEGDPSNAVIISVNNCPRLRFISISRSAQWNLDGDVDHVWDLSVPSLPVQSISCLPTGLRRLKVSGDLLISMSTEAVSKLVERCQDLETFSVQGLDVSEAEGRQVSIAASALKDVEVIGFGDIPPRRFSISSPQLRSLKVTARGFGVRGMEWSVQSGGNLEVLCIKRCGSAPNLVEQVRRQNPLLKDVRVVA